MARKKTDTPTRNEEYAGGFPPGMEAFETLKDPRNGKAKRHYFGEILFIALAAMVCGLEGFDDFARFGELRRAWLKKHLRLPNGTPSADTFRRVFTALDPKAFAPPTSPPSIPAWRANSSPSTAKPCATVSPAATPTTASTSSAHGQAAAACPSPSSLWTGKATKSPPSPSCCARSM
jgi:DDE_Tnp_1-associated